MSSFSGQNTKVHQVQFAGFFENFANTESSPSVDPIGVKIMRCVNKVANRYRMQCRWANSVQKSTYMDGYSEADIWVETEERVITSPERIAFAVFVLNELQMEGLKQIEGPNFKPTVTSFYTQDCDFNLAFSKSDWTDSRRVIPPNSQELRCKLNRQRTLKVLKRLSKLNPEAFPVISGIRLERLVLFGYKEIDRENEKHFEYSSGFLLFKRCLQYFVDSDSALSLVRSVAESIPPINSSDIWKLNAEIFQKWKINSKSILLRLITLYTKPSISVTRQEFQNAFKLSHTISGIADDTTRENQSTLATFTQYDLDHPFTSGAFRWVAKGKYTEGPRNTQDCVCKWFKSGHVFESDFFQKDILAVEKSIEIVKQFNAEKVVTQIIQMNRPEVWVFVSGELKGKNVLQEPFIPNYQKFNSNTGWTNTDTPWPKVMQALSHFSYHITFGRCVLCDLQGGFDESGSLVLTDPAVLSTTREFGVTDLGPQGISSFFSRHVCNEYCEKSWIKPTDRKAYFEGKEGTSMVAIAVVTVAAPLPRVRMAKLHSLHEDDNDY